MLSRDVLHQAGVHRCSYLHNKIARQDQLTWLRLLKSIQDITHHNPIFLSVLAIELLPNCPVVHIVDVRLSDIFVVLHACNNVKLLLLSLKTKFLSNGIKGLLIGNLDVIADCCFPCASV